MEPWTVKSGSVTVKGRRSVYHGEPCWRMTVYKAGRVVYVADSIGRDSASPEAHAESALMDAITRHAIRPDDVEHDEPAPRAARPRKPKANPSIDAERMEARRDWQAARAAYDAAKPPKPLKLARTVATTAGRYLDLGNRSGRQVEHAAHYDATQFLGLAERSAAAVGARANPSAKTNAPRPSARYERAHTHAAKARAALDEAKDRWNRRTARNARSLGAELDKARDAYQAAEARLDEARDAAEAPRRRGGIIAGTVKPKANPSTRYPKGRAPRSLLAHHFTEYGADLAAYERTVGHLESAGYFVIPSDRAWLKAQTHGAAQNPPARRVRRPLSRGRRL